MLFLYRFLINLVFLISPIILVIRLLKGKEDLYRCKEKFCFFSKKRKKGSSFGFMAQVLGKYKVLSFLEKQRQKKK